MQCICNVYECNVYECNVCEYNVYECNVCAMFSRILEFRFVKTKKKQTLVKQFIYLFFCFFFLCLIWAYKTEIKEMNDPSGLPWTLSLCPQECVDLLFFLKLSGELQYPSLIVLTVCFEGVSFLF